MIRTVFLLIGMWCSLHAAAAIDTFTFKDEAQEQQFRQLTEALRCPKCQNNSIADSNAMIASDMKLKVYELMQQGKSKQQIVDYMVERYGHFVTYQPPLTPATVILWVLPTLFIISGAAVIVLRSRRRQKISLTDEASASRRGIAAGNMSLWVFVPGAVLLLGVSAGSYLKISGLAQVQAWRQATAETPALLKRVLDPQAPPLTMEEMARLGVGLRTRLQEQPDNLEGWMMLGRIGMVLNNAPTATHAFAHAYKLAPANGEAKLSYAEVLTRSADAQDSQLGGVLLREMLKDDHTNIRVLSLLAFNAFERQNYREAIGAWEIMLKVLPANDRRRAVIERSLEQARAQIELGTTESADKQ